MKKTFTVILISLLSVVGVSAQGLGLPNLIDINKKVLEHSSYELFQQAGSNYMLLETDWIDVLKLPSVATLGGLSIMNEKCTDMVSKKVAKAIRFRANSSTGVGKILSSAVGVGMPASPDLYVDMDEVPALLAKLKEFQALTQKETAFTCSYNYICKGGFTVSVGFRKADSEKKESVWMGSIGQTGDMVIKDILDSLIQIVEKANSLLSKM
ncbi:MAG: hypothetical protein RR066_04995 [Mucinivorans sp.]